MLFNCIVFQPANEEFLNTLRRALRHAAFPHTLTVFAEPASSLPEELSRIKAHATYQDDDLFLVIRQQADFLTKGDFLNKAVASHLAGGWDWTYPTQSIRSFFTRDNWQMFDGRTLDTIFTSRTDSPDRVLADPQFKVNSRYLMDLASIRNFRRHFPPEKAGDRRADKDAYQFEYWNQRARSYPEDGRTGYVGYYRQRETDFIEEHFVPGHILDCGCGDGKFLETVKARVNVPSFWVGFDFSLDMLRFANQKDASLLQLNLRDLAFKSNSFDYVFAVRSIKNIPSWKGQKKALGQLMHICRKRLVIIDSFSECYTQPIPAYNYLIEEARLISLLEGGTFRLIEKRYYPEPGRPFEYQREPIGDEGFLAFEK